MKDTHDEKFEHVDKIMPFFLIAFEEEKKRHNFVNMFKLFVMSIFHNSQKIILKFVKTYFLVKIVT